MSHPSKFKVYFTSFDAWDDAVSYNKMTLEVFWPISVVVRSRCGSSYSFGDDRPAQSRSHGTLIVHITQHSSDDTRRKACFADEIWPWCSHLRFSGEGARFSTSWIPKVNQFFVNSHDTLSNAFSLVAWKHHSTTEFAMFIWNSFKSCETHSRCLWILFIADNRLLIVTSDQLKAFPNWLYG